MVPGNRLASNALSKVVDMKRDCQRIYPPLTMKTCGYAYLIKSP